MAEIVFIRHGQSQWNLENRFTGWTDVDLTEKGRAESAQAAKLLIEEGYTFDLCYTSLLKRAIQTLGIILDKMDLLWLPVYKNWRLNERHYGALQGLNKAETAAEHGEQQVFIWRRSYDVPPPKLQPDDPRYPGNDRRYKDLSENELPLSECLKDTVERTLPYWHEVISPAVQQGRRVLVAAHGNSLRGIVKYLEDISDEEICNLNIPTGVPLVYQLGDDLKAISKRYLGDPDEVAKAAEAVANQSKAK